MSYTPQYLGHVNIYVRNAERAQQWYADVLGLHTYDFVPGRAAFLSANRDESHEVALMEVGEDAPGLQQRQVGLNHMAWRMASLEDLQECYQRLKEKHIPIDHVSDHGISLGIYFHDPDGNGIEVYYELPRSAWYREDRLFMHGDKPRGHFPGPWDEHLAPASPAAR